MKLPDGFQEQYQPVGEKCSLYGKPVKELTREEMIAVIGWLGCRMKKKAEEPSVFESFYRS